MDQFCKDQKRVYSTYDKINNKLKEVGDLVLLMNKIQNK